ncbi:ABC transporter permease [Reinekea marina]|uniref:ABC transporter permease n=1 Tax=Reinekea marina TaxID=1310421 RepID=A0ABV7WN94_9GAMM|nr:ABC transporter permease [Reinekea marina]MDN3647912.1 ABC transporter permease [Reinekea marina]
MKLIKNFKVSAGRFFKGNPAGIIGASIVSLIIIACLAAPILTDKDPNRRVARGHQPPSSELWFGSTRAGKDVFSQVLYGGRVSLTVAFSAALTTTILALLIGVTSGYVGGKIDEIMMAITNVFLVLPQLPLLIILAAFLGEVGPLIISLIIGFTSWPWGARVMRSQTLVIRQKEFITSAEVMGESKWRIILIEIIPNLISLVAGMFIGTALYAIGMQVTLEFLGLGDASVVSWGTMLYWAQATAALYVGAWWDFVIPGLFVAFVGGGLALLNISIDQVSNPKLRTGTYIKIWKRMKAEIDAKRKGVQS